MTRLRHNSQPTAERIGHAGRPARRRLVALAGALVAMLALASCGDEDDGVELGAKPPDAPKGAKVAWGEPESGSPTAVIMLLHGGGWKPNPAGYRQDKQTAGNLQSQGYATVTIGYGKGAKGLRQVEQVYDQARERYPDLPICVRGISAGGHLALMLATRRPDLTCVIDFVGPTDLRKLAEHDEEGDEGYREAVDAFGEDALAKYSPVRYADRIEAKVLMIMAETDPVNPVEQGPALKRVLPSAELLILPDGPEPAFWAHNATVQPGALDIALERQVEFLREATQGG